MLFPLIHPPLFSTQVYLLGGGVGGGVGLGVLTGDFAGTGKEMVNQCTAQRIGCKFYCSVTMVIKSEVIKLICPPYQKDIFPGWAEPVLSLSIF